MNIIDNSKPLKVISNFWFHIFAQAQMTKHTQKQRRIKKLLRKLGRLSLISGCVLYIYILMFLSRGKKLQQNCCHPRYMMLSLSNQWRSVRRKQLCRTFSSRGETSFSVRVRVSVFRRISTVSGALINLLTAFHTNPAATQQSLHHFASELFMINNHRTINWTKSLLLSRIMCCV